MTYEELRQRCLNYAGMHPNDLSNIEEMVRSISHQPRQRQIDFMADHARFIDMEWAAP